MLIDTHTHLFSEEFDADRPEMIRRAQEAGVSRMYLPNIDSGSIDRMLQLESDFPGICYAMMGLHPCSVNDGFEQELSTVESWLRKRKFAAVGEIGMDYHWDKTWIPQQKEALRRQLRWAKELKLPVVLHQRECFDDLFTIIREEQDGSLKGIFHCFTGTVDQARKIMDLGGFMMGIGGPLTYKNSSLPEVLREIDLKYLVLETDSPYLPPVPFRGKRNESAYIRYTAEKLAEIKGKKLEEVAAATAVNAQSIFGN